MEIEGPFRFDDRDSFLQISYLCVLRAVGRSAGTQPDQKMRIRQLVSSTILIFLVCFSPYHIFLLVRTLLERDCNFITGTLPSKKHWFGMKTWVWTFFNHMVAYSCSPGIFNYYHLSLLLTSLNCVADPALYCFVSESARHGLFRSIFKPVARILCCCRRRGNTSPSNPATDSHEVATEENNGHPVILLTHTNTVSDTQTDDLRKNTTVTTPTDEKNIPIPISVQHHRHSDKHVDSYGINRCVIAMEEQSQKTERTEGPDKSIG